MRTTSSPVIEAELHACVDGQLEADRRPAVMAYLASRPQEAARMDTWRQQNDLIIATFGRIAAEPLPVSLSLNVSAATRYRAVPVGLLPVSTPRLPPAAHNAPGGNLPKPFSAFVGFLLGLSMAFALVALLLLAAQAWHPEWLSRLAPVTGHSGGQTPR